MEAFWRVRGQQPPKLLRERLLVRGSLTQHVRETCPQHFHVKIVRQYWGKPLAEEAKLLGLSPSSYARIREVKLCCNNKPVVFARTIMPLHSLQGALRQLLKLGSQPLGEILFAQHAHRKIAYIDCLKRNHRLFQLASLCIEKSPHAFWIRRSIFILKNKPLLVQEIFI